MVYVIILIVLMALFTFRFISGSILKEDKSQILIFFVYLIYALITFNHRLKDSTVYSNDTFNLFSYFLLTATYILIGEYMCYIYPNKTYRCISFFLYGGIVSAMVNQYILCFFSDIRYIYHICLMYLSIVYVCFSMFFWIKDFRKLSPETKMLMLATNIMIFSFTVLEYLNLKQNPNVAFCAIGLFVYIICAEYASVKKVKQRLSDMDNIEEEALSGSSAKKMPVQSDSQTFDKFDTTHQRMPSTVQSIFDLMEHDPNITTKDIAISLNIQVNTAKSYISQIYSRLGVHSRAEFNELMDKNQ